jgi:DNA polymerase/3'-5' exonuclease PolX
MEDLENSAINILAKFVELLSNLDFIVDHLTDFGKSKYMGFCIIKQTNKNNIARRIDIRFIPFNSYGSSILYFTGSKTFNTQMRTHAIGKGYSLNEYGLKRLANNEFISCKTEEEVFTILNYPYKTPQERDI